MVLSLGNWIFLAFSTATIWVVLLGGAEWLLQTKTLILLVDERAPSWSPKQLKGFVAASWFAYFIWWIQ